MTEQLSACVCVHTRIHTHTHTHTHVQFNLSSVQFSHSVISDSCDPMNCNSVQFSRSVMSDSCDPMNRSVPGHPVHHQLPEFTQTHPIELVMPSSHLILCHHFLLPPSLLPSIRVFSSESTLRMRWPKYWSFSFSISPSNEHPGLISFRMDWSDLLAVQGTLKSLLQHHSSKASIIRHSAFFTVHLSHPYMST